MVILLFLNWNGEFREKYLNGFGYARQGLIFDITVVKDSDDNSYSFTINMFCASCFSVFKILFRCNAFFSLKETGEMLWIIEAETIGCLRYVLS